ncbi:MAG: HEPN domain-containing protein [Chloroflexi bacterium]|nr:HEPN domain-containing protein [Chloroflexota bacterium]
MAGAEAEAGGRRYNNAANRLYYACFLAAVAALIQAGVNPKREEWTHRAVHTEFQGVLINRRHVYDQSLRGFFRELWALRVQADYASQPVSAGTVDAMLLHGRSFVEQVKGVIEG